jgi:3-oxoacyl-[acyl-carrier protein] reductase
MSGKVALVTGGSRGIGRAIVLELAKHGYAIAFTFRQDRLAASALRRSLARRGIPVMWEQHDVSDSTAVTGFVDRALQRFGHLDVLVNNAGVTRDAPLYLMKEQEWVDVVNINLKGVYNFCRACVPHMMRRKRGRIINIASASGLRGVVGQTNYCASKGALVTFSKSLARELAPYQITVNAIAPGFIETDMLKDIPPQRLAEFRRSIPLGRFGTAQEIAELTRFIVERAGYVTGQTIVVDGGLIA